MNEYLNFISVFLAFLSAYIVKDFYDVFIQKHIREWFIKYKKYIKNDNEDIQSLIKKYNDIKKKKKKKWMVNK